MAVKIKTAEDSIDNSEISILNHLNQQGGSDPRSTHVIALLDCFQHQGPNGKHLCIVFEVLSVNISTMLEYTPEYLIGSAFRFPKWMAKRILRQLLLGISFLHSNGVIHGDIHTGNLFFRAPNLDSCTAEQLEDDEENVGVMLVNRLDGKVDKWAPRYLPMAWPLIAHAYRAPDFTVKITDLGGGKLMAHSSI